MPDPATGAVRTTLRTSWELQLRDRVSTLAWSPGGDSLAAGSLGGDAVLVAADDGSRRAMADHDGGVLSTAWSPDGRGVAVGGQDAMVSVASRTGVRRWSTGCRDWVGALAWGRKGLAAAAGPDVVVLAEDGGLVADYPLLPGHVNDLAWDDRTGHLAVALRSGVHWYDPPRPGLAASVASVGTVLSLAPSPDGTVLAGGKLNGAVVLWTVSTGRGIVLSGYRGGVRRLSWRADGAQLAVAAHGETSVWSLRDGRPNGEPIGLLELQPAAGGLGFHPYLDLLATGGADGEVCLWRPGRTGEPAASTSVGAEVTALAWHPTGDGMAVGTAEGGVAFLALA